MTPPSETGNSDAAGPGEGLPAIADVERGLLGSERSLTRIQVAEQAGVDLDLAQELWQQLGFPHAADDDVAFTEQDVTALRMTDELIRMGILTPDSQAALVRTWGRSFARLAEWQVNLLAEVALAADPEDPGAQLTNLMDEVLPRVEKLQDYVWRRHLGSAAGRLLGHADEVGSTSKLAVVFVDIVGYTSQSKSLSDTELVDWVEHFEDEMARIVVELGGRIIKTIGDEVLFVTDDPRASAEVALIVTEKGADEEDKFPDVRAGIAYGDVVSRLGDVYGPTVNIASRLTTLARPGTVLVDRGAYEALTGPLAEDSTETVEMSVSDDAPSISKILDRAAEELAELSPYTKAGDYRFRRMPRRSVKGYSRLEPWVLRRAKSATQDAD